MSQVFVGIDLGTSGIRAVGVDEQGTVIAAAQEAWGCHEEDPHRWLRSLRTILAHLQRQFTDPSPVDDGSRPILERKSRSDLKPRSVAALSVCGTSGTIVAVDQWGQPLQSAWLYTDRRGQVQAQQLGISSSWGLSRWLWWRQTDPENYRHSYLAHPTDVLLTALGGPPRVTDHTSALKSGFDLEAYRWPVTWLEEHDLNVDQFPEVVAPGTPLGSINPEWGLGSDVVLVAGTTDGCAGQLAAGAVSPGQASTSLGTTLIFKATSHHKIETSNGSVYSHLHPDRTSWLPGAASSCGGGVLQYFFPTTDLADWDQRATMLLPTGQISYPLWQPGERFPLTDPDFRGSLPTAEPGSLAFYAGLLEGVAWVERFGWERLQQLGLDLDDALYTTGGACQSSVWLQIRASVLNRQLIVARYPQPAVGAAMVAAAGFWGCAVEQAVQRLTQVGQIIHPRQEWVAAYEDLYREFIDLYAKGDDQRR